MRRVAVALLPVLREGTGRQGQDLGGEVLRLDPRQDQEVGVVDDQVRVSDALFGTPADKAVLRCTLPATGPEAEHGWGLLFGGDEVAQLRLGQPMETTTGTGRWSWVPGRRPWSGY